MITSVATLSSIFCGLWKRNGTPAAGTLFFYDRFRTWPSLRRCDLVFLQSVAAIAADPGRVVMALMQRYRLLSWANGELDKKYTTNYNEQFIKDTCGLSEEFLRVVIAMLTERTVNNMSDITLRKELRYRVIQTLCCSENPSHSTVGKCNIGVCSNSSFITRVSFVSSQFGSARRR